jgi:tetratricopeptide (TPR) repeat protein
MLPHLLVGCALLATPLPSGASPAAVAARQTQEKPSTDPYYYFVLGRHLESEGDVEGAIKAHQQAAALDPKSAEIRAELAGLQARQNRAREAIEWAEASLRLDAENAEANRVLGLVYASMSRLDDESSDTDAPALEAARKATTYLEAARRRAADPGVDFMLGRLYLKVGDSGQAIAALRRVVDQDPERGEPVALLARAYEHDGRTADAVRLLESAVSAHPQFYASLGELYDGQHRWKDAASAYERALARDPRSLDLKTRLALAWLSEGGTAPAGRAAAVLKDARKQSPTDPQLVYLLSQAERAAGQLDDAESTARQLLALAPGGTTGPYALAQVYDEKQEYRRVVEVLEPVVDKSRAAGARTDADLLPLTLTLASAYEELGDFDRALATFDKAKAISPANRNIDIYELGVLVSAQRFPEAIQLSGQLAASHPDDERVVRLRATALGGAGRKDEAVALLREALAAHPDDPSAHLALSETLATSRQFDAAVAVLDEAAKRFPANPTVRFQLGSVLERGRRFADAERVFRELLSKDPLYAPALNYLGYMLAERGERLDESIALIKRALQVEPYNGAYLDSLGWAYFKSNRLDLAEENLRKAADRRVRDSAVQDHFGDLLLRLGRPKDAIGAWRKALDGDGEQISRDEIARKIRSASNRAAK